MNIVCNTHPGHWMLLNLPHWAFNLNKVWCVLTCSWSTSSSPVMMILFSIRVSEYPPFTVCNTRRLSRQQQLLNPPRRTAELTLHPLSRKTAQQSNQELFTGSDPPLWRGLLRRWHSRRWGWANPPTLYPGCLHAPGGDGGERGRKKKQESGENCCKFTNTCKFYEQKAISVSRSEPWRAAGLFRTHRGNTLSAGVGDVTQSGETRILKHTRSDFQLVTLSYFLPGMKIAHLSAFWRQNTWPTWIMLIQ